MRADVGVMCGSSPEPEAVIRSAGISSRVRLQKCLDVSLDPLGQRRIGRRIVVGAGTEPGKRAAVVAVLVALFIFIIGIIVVSRRASLHEIGLRKILPYVDRPHSLAICIDQAAIGLAGEDHSGNTAEQHGKYKAAEQQ